MPDFAGFMLDFAGLYQLKCRSLAESIESEDTGVAPKRREGGIDLVPAGREVLGRLEQRLQLGAPFGYLPARIMLIFSAIIELVCVTRTISMNSVGLRDSTLIS